MNAQAKKPPPIRGALPADVYCGQQIRAGRLLAGFSQGELGLKIGVTFQQVQKYEKGANRVGSSRLAKIAAELRQPITYFFKPTSGTLAQDEDDPVRVLGQTRAGISLAKAFNAIEDEPLRTAFVHLAHLIAASNQKAA